MAANHANNAPVLHHDEVCIFVVIFIDEMAVSRIHVLRDFTYESAVIKTMNLFEFLRSFRTFKCVMPDFEHSGPPMKILSQAISAKNGAQTPRRKGYKRRHQIARILLKELERITFHTPLIPQVFTELTATSLPKTTIRRNSCDFDHSCFEDALVIKLCLMLDANSSDFVNLGRLREFLVGDWSLVVGHLWRLTGPALHGRLCPSSDHQRLMTND